MTLRIGTRGSALALTQSGLISQQLEQAGHANRLEIIRTAGDRNQTASFGAIGAQGVFVREIENALLAGEVDIAVHSFKDLPTASPDALIVAAVPEREDPVDVLILRENARAGNGWLPLPEGARVGTASARRAAWLAHFRSDLRVAPLRGNVPTRLERLREGRFDAILLAAAGIARLGDDAGTLAPLLEGLARIRLTADRFVPAPAQGALALQCRRDDQTARAILAALDHAPTRIAVETERAALALAEGGCDTAFGAWCEPQATGYRLTAMLERGGRVLEASVAGADPAALPAHVFEAVAAAGDAAAERS
jgi:hydroxymethylbilane synthase